MIGLVECGYSTGEVNWKKEDFPKLASVCFENQVSSLFNET